MLPRASCLPTRTTCRALSLPLLFSGAYIDTCASPDGVFVVRFRPPLLRASNSDRVQ
ncbi:hypothetical protein PF008_g24326 [Phytophthora fragariae]|uniref:Uncharacterized protein n=1 Tax=Phytophthora fragariae TaxID=53985 RepID=A0A6G0QNV2_9STRA|nr:hypothetical protein PF008_g24326 [Phytophthora fragariae]